MTRSRTLLAALAAICAVALIVVIATLISRHVSSRSTSSQRDVTRRDIAHSIGPTTSSPDNPFPDDTFTQPEPPPEPNVTGIVVDEEGEPVEGALVTARHLVPYLSAPLSEDLEGRYDFGPKPEPDGEPLAPGSDMETGGLDPGVPIDNSLAWRPGDNGIGFEPRWQQRARTGPAWGTMPECLSDEAGRFALHVCGEFWYALVVSKEAYDSPLRVFHEPREGIRLVLYGPGSIVGHVVDTDTGEPVTHFVASLSQDFPYDGFGGGTESDPLEERCAAFDNERGEFRFDEILGTGWHLGIEADGYISHAASIEPVAGRTTRIAVRLCRRADLEGTVVWDASGTPVTNAEVAIRSEAPPINDPWSPDLFGRTCRLDPDGRFEFSVLPYGEATISVRACGKGGGREYIIVEKKLTLAANETTHVVLRASETPASVSGTVVHQDTGGGIPGAVLSLHHSVFGGWASFDEKSGEQFAVTSGDDGTFCFAAVPPESYMLDVSHERYRMPKEHVLDLGYGDTVEGLVVQLAEPGCLEGRVTDASGKPAAATIYCTFITQESAETRTSDFSRRAGTDEEGRFRIEDIPSGHATVTCCFDRREEMATRRLVQIEPNARTQADFVVPAMYSVSGTVTVAGVPVARAELRLLPDLLSTDLTAGAAGGYYDLTGETDEEGRFRIDDVPQGKYTLFCTADGGLSTDKSPARTPVEIVESSVEVDVQLATSIITGHVYDSQTHEPMCRAAVLIQRKGERDDPAGCPPSVIRLGATDTDAYTGEYSFCSAADGSHVITAWKDGYGAKAVEVKIADGVQIGNADLWLSPGYEVRCTITAANHRTPPGRVIVTVRDASDMLVTTRLVLPYYEGREPSLGHLSPGDYVLEARSSETAWQLVHQTVTEHGENVVGFCLPEGNTLAVEVSDAMGAPVHGAIPSLEDALGRSRRWRSGDYREDWHRLFLSASDGKGVTRIEHLLPGTYTLTIRAAGYTAAEQQVDVLDTDETRVKVVLERLHDE
jgi:hypothetical protein